MPQIDSLPILDSETAIEQLGDKELFETLIEGFDGMSLQPNLMGLKKAIEGLDYFNIRLQAHSLKGASSYLHAERVKVMAEKIQFDVDRQAPLDIFRDYPILIEQSIILKQKIRMEICKKNGMDIADISVGQKYLESVEDFDIPIANLYQLVKKSSRDFEVALVTKLSPLPPIPKYDFARKNNAPTTVSLGNIQGTLKSDSKRQTAEKPAADVKPKTKSENKLEASSKLKGKVTPKQSSAKVTSENEGTTFIDSASQGSKNLGHPILKVPEYYKGLQVEGPQKQVGCCCILF